VNVALSVIGVAMEIDIMLYSQVRRVHDKQPRAEDWALRNQANDVHDPRGSAGEPNTVRSAAQVRPEPQQCDTA